jgi:hypothetical protein
MTSIVVGIERDSTGIRVQFEQDIAGVSDPPAKNLTVPVL